MRWVGRVMFRDVFITDKGRAYVTGVDMENGGDIKFETDPDKAKQLPPLKEVKVEMVVRGRAYGLNVGYSVESVTIIPDSGAVK